MKKKWLYISAAAVVLIAAIWWYTPVHLFRESEFSFVRLSYWENGTETSYDTWDVEEEEIERQLMTMEFRRVLHPFYQDLSQIEYQLTLNKQGNRFPNLYLSRDGDLDMVQDHPLDGLVTVRYRILNPDGLRELLNELTDH